MSAVVGLDLSLSGTGVAHADGRTETLKARPASLRGGERLSALRTLLLPAVAPDVRLFVIEDYAPGAIGLSGKLGNAQWRGVVELTIAERAPRAAVAFVRPNTLKRWATGNGGADKAEMVAAALADGWVGDPARDDEADAFHLRGMGLQYLNGGGTPARLAYCDEVPWPEVKAA